VSRGVERSAADSAKRQKALQIRAEEPKVTAPEIAKRVHVHVSTVRRWLLEAKQQVRSAT